MVDFGYVMEENMIKKIFLVFQGGGAKGIAHIGGLAAWEEVKQKVNSANPDGAKSMELAGVAGTSAGAIIASLVAAGYEAEQLYKIGPNPDHLLKRIAGGRYERPSSLFGRMGWFYIKSLRNAARQAADRPLLARMAGLLSIVAILAWWITPGLVLSPYSKLAAVILLSLLLYFMPKGIAGLAQVRKVVDEAIANGPLKGRVPDKEVTFAHLKGAKGLPLKLVATNLTSRTVELFSFEDSPDTVIADAVCASVCLPLIFPPFRLSLSGGNKKQEPSNFIDGGLLSNLPLWPFDEERKIWPDTQTIGFSLQPLKGKNPTSQPMLLSLIDAIVSGPARIHARSIPGLVMVRLPTTLDMLDFDKGFVDFGNAIESAKEYALGIMERDFGLSVVEKLLEELNDNIVKHLLSVQEAGLEDGQAGNVSESELNFRLSIIVSRPEHKQSLSPRFEVGHVGESAAQRMVLVSADKSRVTEVMNKCTPMLEDKASSGVVASNMRDTARLGDSLWMMLFPLQADSELSRPLGTSPAVLTLDSPTLTSDHFQSMLGLEAQAGLSGLLELLAKVVNTFDEKRSIGNLALSIQSWN